jgi:excinuclease UvrABC helicase subunit UvrB
LLLTRCIASSHLGNTAGVKQVVDYFKEIGKHLEAKRFEERTNFDLDDPGLGYCLELKTILGI